MFSANLESIFIGNIIINSKIFKDLKSHYFYLSNRFLVTSMYLFINWDIIPFIIFCSMPLRLYCGQQKLIRKLRQLLKSN